jgi:hypothetical protein
MRIASRALAVLAVLVATDDARAQGREPVELAESARFDITTEAGFGALDHGWSPADGATIGR